MLVLAGFLGAVGIGCMTGPSPYQTELRSAEDARRSKEFDSERTHFKRAMTLADNDADKSEAQYRHAHTWNRQGEWEKAATELERLVKEFPNAPRAGRALLDAGRAWEKLNQRKKSLSAFRLCVRKYPEFGGSISAAERWVALQSEGKSTTEAAQWAQLRRENKSSVLDEALRFHHAKALETSSPLEAVEVYEELARTHPLPRGVYADEALFNSARLRRGHGDPQGALIALQVLTEQDSHAKIVGSYARPAYAEAWLLRGRILQEDLGRSRDARAAWQSLVEIFPDSRLVDDALLDTAQSLKSDGDDACPTLNRLRELRPNSGLLGCAPALCDEWPEAHKSSRRCNRVTATEN